MITTAQFSCPTGSFRNLWNFPDLFVEFLQSRFRIPIALLTGISDGAIDVAGFFLRGKGPENLLTNLR
jgi:hypothetical protein